MTVRTGGFGGKLTDSREVFVRFRGKEVHLFGLGSESRRAGSF
jgi:hypothetical protein